MNPNFVLQRQSYEQSNPNPNNRSNGAPRTPPSPPNGHIPFQRQSQYVNMQHQTLPDFPWYARAPQRCSYDCAKLRRIIFAQKFSLITLLSPLPSSSSHNHSVLFTPVQVCSPWYEEMVRASIYAQICFCNYFEE